MEELLRSFTISRESLSVRVLDQSLDPTPLLKEIRDDKVATIIIHANASVSYRILRKVPPHGLSQPIRAQRLLLLLLIKCYSFCCLQASELGMTSAFYKYILTTMVRRLFLPLLSLLRRKKKKEMEKKEGKKAESLLKENQKVKEKRPSEEKEEEHLSHAANGQPEDA